MKENKNFFTIAVVSLLMGIIAVKNTRAASGVENLLVFDEEMPNWKALTIGLASDDSKIVESLQYRRTKYNSSKNKLYTSNAVIIFGSPLVIPAISGAIAKI